MGYLLHSRSLRQEKVSDSQSVHLASPFYWWQVEPKRIPEETDAARYIKYLLYAISGVLLLFFVLVVTCRP